MNTRALSIASVTLRRHLSRRRMSTETGIGPVRVPEPEPEPKFRWTNFVLRVLDSRTFSYLSGIAFSTYLRHDKKVHVKLTAIKSEVDSVVATAASLQKQVDGIGEAISGLEGTLGVMMVRIRDLEAPIIAAIASGEVELKAKLFELRLEMIRGLESLQAEIREKKSG